MEHELCEPKERESKSRHSDGPIPSIGFRDYTQEDYKALVPLMWEYWFVVNQEDHSSGRTLS